MMNERQIQTTEENVDSSKALDNSLVETETSGTESGEQDTSSKSEKDAHADDADIRPIYDEEPMAEVQLITDHNVFVTGQQHTEQPEFNNEGKVDQNAEQCHDECLLPSKLTDNQINEHSYQSLEFENICLRKTVAQFQKVFLRMEANCVNLELKYQNQALKEGQHGQFLKVKSNEAKVKDDIDSLHIICLRKENMPLKPHYMIAPSSSRYSSNDMAHNHYLEEAKKKTQESSRNSRPSVMPSARSQSTANGSKPKPRINYQNSRNWPASKSSFGLRWVPTGKIFTSSTTKVDSKPANGSNENITSQYECGQTLDVSACTLNLTACTSFNPKKEGLRVCCELGIHDHSNEPSSSKLVPKVVPPADKTTTSQQELELLFSPLYEGYFNAGI
nr:hypothetical protein [Tanacetum cinerariifolium]